MIIEKKQPTETVKRDYGNTVTPKMAVTMLTGLTDELSLLNDRLFALVRGVAYVGIHAKLFGEQRKISRYELTDVINLRDCLYAVNKAQHSTFVGRYAKNHPMRDCFLRIKPDKQKVDSFAETVKSAMPNIPCVFVSGEGGIIIKTDDALIRSGQSVTEAIETITDVQEQADE